MIDHAQWRKSSHSGAGNNCVEVAVTPSGTAIRDSKCSDGPQFDVPLTSWVTFLSTTTAGQIAR